MVAFCCAVKQEHAVITLIALTRTSNLDGTFIACGETRRILSYVATSHISSRWGQRDRGFRLSITPVR